MLGTLPRRKLRDLVTDGIKSYILSEQLAPGDRLPTEAELAERFGVSRLSLRESTKALEFLGIVESKAGVGLTVGQMNMSRVTECLGFHPSLQLADPRMLVDTRVVIETGVLPHVARRMQDDPSVYVRLNEINRQLRQARTVQRWVELDIAFHRGLVEESELSPLMAFADVLTVFFQRFRESVKRAEWTKGVAGHQSLIDELRLGRVPQATQILREHIESHLDRAGGRS
jgi:GntR family transcriptional regulator, transcriptional repressor for pyruvate dehydrogenase complex